MARMASEAKCGFYPTPHDVCDILAESFRFTAPGVTFTEICSGDGRMIHRIISKSQFPARVVAVELDKQRFETTQAVVSNLEQSGKVAESHVFKGDFIAEIKIRAKCFDFLFSNPPYDETGTGDGRLEKVIIEKALAKVVPNGVVCFIIPYTSLKQLAESLSRLSDLELYLLPDQQFRQIAVTGRMKPYINKEQRREQKLRLRWLAVNAPDELPMLEKLREKQSKIAVRPMAAKVPVSIQCLHVDPYEMQVQTRVLKDSFLNTYDPLRRNGHRILAPLSDDHAGIIIAGGWCNGHIGGGKVVKGKVSPIEVVSEEFNEEFEITETRKSYMTQLNLLDVNTGELSRVRMKGI